MSASIYCNDTGFSWRSKEESTDIGEVICGTDYEPFARDTIRQKSGIFRSFHTDGPPSKYVNRRTLDKDAPTYELEKFSRNKMLIFNQENCHGQESRTGTHRDVEALTECFEKRDFEVDCFKDCTYKQLFDTLNNAICQDLSDYGCFAVVVLTHGSHDGLLLAKDRPFLEYQLVDALKGSNAPSLLSKPKLLIIQACRGDCLSRAVAVGTIPKEFLYEYDNHGSRNHGYTMADESDFLIIHGTFPGMMAHRSKEYGTWFIQSLCKFVNNAEEHDDMLAILTDVCRDVSVNHSNRGVTAEDKQVPELRSTLLRRLYLNSIVNVVKQRFMRSVFLAETLVKTNSNEYLYITPDENDEMDDNDYVITLSLVGPSLVLWKGEIIRDVKKISKNCRSGMYLGSKLYFSENLFSTGLYRRRPILRSVHKVPRYLLDSSAPFYRSSTLNENVKDDVWWCGRRINRMTDLSHDFITYIPFRKLYYCSSDTYCAFNQHEIEECQKLWSDGIINKRPIVLTLCSSCMKFVMELPEEHIRI